MIKHLHNAVLYWISNHGVLSRHTVSECSSAKLNEIIELDQKKCSYRNLNGMFRLILMIYMAK